MRIRQQRTVVTVLLAAAMLLAGCGGSAANDTSSSTTSADAEQPVALLSGNFTTISGSEIDLGSLEGQDVVLWFWAPW